MLETRVIKKLSTEYYHKEITKKGYPYTRCYWKIEAKTDSGWKCAIEHRIDGPAMKDTDGNMAWFYFGKQLHIHPDKVSKGDVVIFGLGPVLVLEHLEGLIYEVMRGDHKFKIMFEQKKYIETMARKGHDYYDL